MWPQELIAWLRGTAEESSACACEVHDAVPQGGEAAEAGRLRREQQLKQRAQASAIFAPAARVCGPGRAGAADTELVLAVRRILRHAA